jgi:hypothetical protein
MKGHVTNVCEIGLSVGKTRVKRRRATRLMIGGEIHNCLIFRVVTEGALRSVVLFRVWVACEFGLL